MFGIHQLQSQRFQRRKLVTGVQLVGVSSRLLLALELEPRLTEEVPTLLMELMESEGLRSTGEVVVAAAEAAEEAVVELLRTMGAGPTISPG